MTLYGTGQQYLSPAHDPLAGWQSGAEVSAAPGASVLALAGAQLGTVLAALDDAAEAREARGSDSCCRDCAVSASGKCFDHLSDLAASGTYRALRAELGGQR